MSLKNVLRNLEKMQEEIARRSDKALLSGGIRIMSAAQKRTPVDTGELRRSAKTELLKKATATKAGTVSVSFNKEYAAAVHEDLAVQHPTGESKFLEVAVLREQGDVLAEFKRVMRA